ncbi:MAG TPA: MarR family transcriptional regulator [Hyphomonadaceae bacterium]|nr:MarR family transcriptional regulator [Hyphomonadaceae bacterium]HPN06038.1 MarR family transcriptional regulator [Hyphomonadaceae bacterium]
MDRATALALLKDVLAETVRADGPDLNVRQAAILLRVSLEPGPHTVRGLAEALSLGKPAVSRALDALSGLGLATRMPDETDRRSVLVQTTDRGHAVLAGLGDRVIACERANAAAVQKAAAAQSAQKSPDNIKPTASSQPPVSSKPVVQPSASPSTGQRDAGSSSHAL